MQADKLSKKLSILILGIALFVLISVGAVVLNSMVASSPYLNGFYVVNKQVVVIPDNFWIFQHSVTEYRVFYDTGVNDYVLTTEGAFSNVTVYHWFDGPFIVYS